jgi:hypothetical protein
MFCCNTQNASRNGDGPRLARTEAVGREAEFKSIPPTKPVLPQVGYLFQQPWSAVCVGFALELAERLSAAPAAVFDYLARTWPCLLLPCSSQQSAGAIYHRKPIQCPRRRCISCEQVRAGLGERHVRARRMKGETCRRDRISRLRSRDWPCALRNCTNQGWLRFILRYETAATKALGFLSSSAF